MTDREALLQIKALVDAQLAQPHLPPVDVEPEKPPQPPSGPGKPAPVGFIIGPALTGTNGNPQLVYNIPGNCTVSYEYAFSPSDNLRNFYAAGQSTNGTPPFTWVWIAGNADGSHPFTTPARMGGTGVAPLESINIKWMREQGITKLYFCEQPEPDGAGTLWNRYAQVG